MENMLEGCGFFCVCVYMFMGVFFLVCVEGWDFLGVVCFRDFIVGFVILCMCNCWWGGFVECRIFGKGGERDRMVG